MNSWMYSKHKPGTPEYAVENFIMFVTDFPKEHWEIRCDDGWYWVGCKKPQAQAKQIDS